MRTCSIDLMFFQSRCHPCASAARTFLSSSSISFPACVAECRSRLPTFPAKLMDALMALGLARQRTRVGEFH